MPTIYTEGIILSRKKIGEADRLMTVFSKEYGKLRVIAKGSRKIKSKMASHIEPFTVGRYYLIEGKAFYILAGAESLEQNEKIMSDLDIYKDASYISEITAMIISEGVPNPSLYSITKDVLLNIVSREVGEREVALRFFEYKLLESIGYKPNFRKCLRCGMNLKEDNVYFGTFEGIICCEKSREGLKIDKNTLKILRLFGENNLSEVLKIKNLPIYNDSLKEVILPFLYDILPNTPKAKNL